MCARREGIIELLFTKGEPRSLSLHFLNCGTLRAHTDLLQIMGYPQRSRFVPRRRHDLSAKSA